MLILVDRLIYQALRYDPRRHAVPDQPKRLGSSKVGMKRLTGSGQTELLSVAGTSSLPGAIYLTPYHLYRPCGLGGMRTGPPVRRTTYRAESR